MKLKSAIISVALVCSLVSLSSVCKAESFGFFFEDHGTSFSMRQSTQMVTEHHLLQEAVTISIHQSLQDLIISLSIDHLILMLHHLHLDILDMMVPKDLIIIGKQKGRALHDLLLSFESYLAPLPNSTTLIVSNMILISKRIDQLSI